MNHQDQQPTLAQIEASAHRMRSEALREMVLSFMGRRARRAAARAV